MSRRKGLAILFTMLAGIAVLTIGAFYLVVPDQSTCDPVLISCMKKRLSAGLFAILEVLPAFVVFTLFGFVAIVRRDRYKMGFRMVLLGTGAVGLAAFRVALVTM